MSTASPEVFSSGHSPNVNGNAPLPAESVPPPVPFDASLFKTYLLSIVPPVIGATPDDLEPIFDGDFDEKVAKFAVEGMSVIYVVKVKDEGEGESQ